MEAVNPVLSFVWEVQKGYYEGYSIRWVLLDYIKHYDNELAEIISHQCVNPSSQISNLKSIGSLSMETQTLLETIKEGVNGLPIEDQLIEFEGDIKRHSLEQIEIFMSKLPFYMMIPLLGFQFPSLMILTLGVFFQYNFNF